MGLFLIILGLYLIGVGVCYGALPSVEDRFEIFEGSDYFLLLAIFWPFTLIPVAAWIFAVLLLRKE